MGVDVFVSSLAIFIVRFKWNAVKDNLTYCSFSICEFRNNLDREGRPLLVSVNEITFKTEVLRHIHIKQHSGISPTASVV